MECPSQAGLDQGWPGSGPTPSSFRRASTWVMVQNNFLKWHHNSSWNLSAISFCRSNLYQMWCCHLFNFCTIWTNGDTHQLRVGKRTFKCCCVLCTLWVRKIVKNLITKIDPYKCFQSELEADFWCIEELRSLAVQCISFRLPTRNISSQRDQSDRSLFWYEIFWHKITKTCSKNDISWSNKCCHPLL